MVDSSGHENVPGVCDGKSATVNLLDVSDLGRDVRPNLTIETVDLAADALELIVIPGLECRVALRLQLAHFGLDARLVDADHRVVLVGIDPQRLAQRGKQMILVHLREPLHRVVLFDGLSDLPELLDGFPLQVVIRVSHGLLHLKTISIASRCD